jgi:hypothetical protein
MITWIQFHLIHFSLLQLTRSIQILWCYVLTVFCHSMAYQTSDLYTVNRFCWNHGVIDIWQNVYPFSSFIFLINTFKYISMSKSCITSILFSGPEMHKCAGHIIILRSLTPVLYEHRGLWLHPQFFINYFPNNNIP